MSEGITIRGMDDLLRKLDGIADPRWVEKPQKAVLEEARDYISEYPGQPSYPLKWASDRQRKAFFATDGFGKGIPYRRSGARGFGNKSSWVIKTSPRRGVLTSRKTYAGFIAGWRTQQPFHKATGWRTDRDTVQHVSPKASRIFANYANRILEGRRV